jgi:hypothetical protein
VPVYPVLTALYLVLALAAENGSELIQLADLVRPLFLSLIAGLCLWGVASLVTGGARPGALVGAVAILCFSLFGPIAQRLRAPLEVIGGPTGLLILLGYLLAACALVLRRRKATFTGVTRYLNLVVGLLVTYAALRVAFDTSLSESAARSFEPVRSSVPLVTSRQHGPRPDIYLIVLDKYTGSRILASHYGFDNQPFEDSLRAREFIVPSRARANYIHTSLALAAMLNLDYLDDLPDRFGKDSDDWELVYPLVEKHEIAAFLRGRGYRYVFFPSAFAPTRRSRIADAQIPDPSLVRPEFEAVWLWSTPIPLVHAQACRVIGCQVHRFSYTPESAELLDWKLNRLPELAGGDRPVFVFAHLTLPHEPYVYDKSCRHRDPYWPMDDMADTLAVKEAYIAQIECLNRKLLRLVDEVSRRSGEPPVILLQSDHGHGRLGRWAPGLEATTGWQVAERSAIFAAYSLPGVPRAAVSDSISPVNVTRLVLRHYFGADLPELPDLTYWSAWGRPYRFTRLE